jgi:hypothetical protein
MKHWFLTRWKTELNPDWTNGPDVLAPTAEVAAEQCARELALHSENFLNTTLTVQAARDGTTDYTTFQLRAKRTISISHVE